MQASSIIQVLFLHKPAPYELIYILPWIAMGSLAQCLVTIPHSLQVAMGYEKRVFLINLFFLPLYIFLVYYLVKDFQMIGAAIAFLAFNISRMLAHFLCLELSSGQRIKFLTKNISIFILCALFAYLFNMIHIGTMLTFVKLLFSFIVISFFVFLSCSQLRLYLKKPIKF
jgi:O-antigen/teichoic acid export membrane protein